jgi:hypothetical protein
MYSFENNTAKMTYIKCKSVRNLQVQYLTTITTAEQIPVQRNTSFLVQRINDVLDLVK